MRLIIGVIDDAVIKAFEALIVPTDQAELVRARREVLENSGTADAILLHPTFAHERYGRCGDQYSSNLVETGSATRPRWIVTIPAIAELVVTREIPYVPPPIGPVLRPKYTHEQALYVRTFRAFKAASSFAATPDGSELQALGVSVDFTPFADLKPNNCAILIMSAWRTAVTEMNRED